MTTSSMAFVHNPGAMVNGGDHAAESFYAGALDRIRRFMLALALLFTAAGWARFGGRVAVGFALGCLIAYVNFYWLKRAVGGLAESVAAARARPSGWRLAMRFLLRYFLMALGGYVIFKFAPASLYGLLAGLFLPVGAILCEGAYEVYSALRRGL